MDSRNTYSTNSGGTEMAEKRKRSQPPETLTRTERDVLIGLEKAISFYVNPSLAEIAKCSGPTYYAPSVGKYLRRLAAKGYVKLPEQQRRIRGVQLVKPYRNGNHRKQQPKNGGAQ